MLLTHDCCSSLTRQERNQICCLLTIYSFGHSQVSPSYALSASVPETTLLKSSSPRFWCFTQIPQSTPNPPASKPAATQENIRHHRWKESSPYTLSLLTILPVTRQAQQNDCRGTAARPRQRAPRFCYHHGEAEEHFADFHLRLLAMEAEHTVLLLLCSKTPSHPAEELQVKSFIRLKGYNGAAFFMTIKKNNAGYDNNIRCHGLSPSQERRTQKDSNTY